MFGDSRSPEAKALNDAKYGVGNWKPNADGKGITVMPSVLPDVGKLIDTSFGTSINNTGWGDLLDFTLVPGGIGAGNLASKLKEGVKLLGSGRGAMTRFSQPIARTATKTAAKVLPSAKEVIQLPAGKVLQLPPHRFVFKDVLQKSLNAKDVVGQTKVNLFKNLMPK
jgi:hypothetical protein